MIGCSISGSGAQQYCRRGEHGTQVAIRAIILEQCERYFFDTSVRFGEALTTIDAGAPFGSFRQFPSTKHENDWRPLRLLIHSSKRYLPAGKLAPRWRRCIRAAIVEPLGDDRHTIETRPSDANSVGACLYPRGATR
ncbi:hypothetical protein ACVOMS_34945 [Bradyrhizobium guangxiense]